MPPPVSRPAAVFGLMFCNLDYQAVEQELFVTLTQTSLEISCREVERWRLSAKDFLLLDCREPEEQELVALEGALLLPMSQLVQRCQELAGQENKQLVVYCHHGMRSAQVVAWLRQQGFHKAQSMAGGIDAWAQEIEPEMPRY
ncbi:MAG: rhodanese [Pirellulales bacterium]|nr:rhodanese [Pirellulales bacterium]